MAVHGLEHLETGTVQSHNRKIVVEGSKPPFIGMMLIRDQVRNVPGQEIEGISRQMARLMDSNSRLHRGGGRWYWRSLQERTALVQECSRRCGVRVGKEPRLSR